MATSKAALRSIKAAIDASDFAKAAIQAHELVKDDRKNYNGFMFLGFAEEKLNHFEEAERAIRTALSLKPGDIQAFKGLITLYEKQNSGILDRYHDAAFELANIYAQQGNADQCQSIIDKYELFAKKHGSRSQYRKALELMLPINELYNTLEGRVPHPSHTYQRILESCQAEEKEWISNQISERRTRLGAKLDRVTLEVNNEAMTRFNIEQAYQNLIDWTQNDEARHNLDQELLQRMMDNLMAMPAAQKPYQRDRVLEKANGMVIIKQKFILAWHIALEWVDADDLGDWDVTILREFVDYFPDDGLALVIQGFLAGKSSPFPAVDKDDTETSSRLSEADQLIMMNEGLEICGNSMLAHRIMAQMYLYLDEYLSAIEMARKSVKLYLKAQSSYGLKLQDSLDSVNLTLGRALIPYHSPRHHPEAKGIFENILERKPLLTAALLGVGLIFEEDEDFTEAVKFLTRASERDSANVRINMERAWCEALSHDLETGMIDLEAVLTQIEGEPHGDLSMKAEVLYRIAYCKWNLDTSSKARKDKNGPYRYLINALKANPNYAPAYTLLGIYFQDYVKNKSRARVALQKAFELSTSELGAAERLAQAFANSGEWDLVELVAHRVVESGKARPAPGSKKKAYSWPFAALGVVQMSRSQYSQSIVSFQQALRISPNDYHSWVGLGESYHNSGRYVAASRAFYRAESIDHGLSPDQSWFAKYMLANVQQELGAYEEASIAYEGVLKVNPDEFGVLISLLQTTTEFASTRQKQGRFGDAVNVATKAISIAKQISEQRTDVFNLWKSLGDACAIIGNSKIYAPVETLAALKEILQADINEEQFSSLVEIDKVSLQDLDKLTKSASDVADQFLIGCILAHKRAIYASAQDIHAQAVSWYNLGWAEHEAYISSGLSLAPKNKKSRHFLKAAMRSFKHAIELEASNADFWNALGISTITLNSQVSQHAFIRSLHLNELDAKVWTNLGVLYLLNNENELANQAFTRAQSTDPEYAAAWIGQGLLAHLYGKMREAQGLFTHAFEIADSSSVPAKRYYAVTAFDHLVKNPSLSSEISNLLQPLFALRQLHTQIPTDVVTSQSLSLFAERVHEYTTATSSLEEVCDATEASYESTESQESLARFAQAKADLARQQLGNHNFAEAIESAQFALDLSPDGDEDLDPAYANRRRKWQLGAHLTIGLAQAHLGAMSESIASFQSAIKLTGTSVHKGTSSARSDAICLLAQALWAHEGEKEREASRSQLFACVEENPNHIGAVTLLAVTMLLDGDTEGLEVAEEDLQTLRMNANITVADQLQIAQVLGAINLMRQKSGDEAIAHALEGIMLSPAQPQGWLELAQVTETNNNDAGEEEHKFAGEMALRTALKQIPPGGNLTARDLAKTYAATGDWDGVRQAVMLAPGLQDH